MKFYSHLLLQLCDVNFRNLLSRAEFQNLRQDIQSTLELKHHQLHSLKFEDYVRSNSASLLPIHYRFQGS
jgi:hypothetical protein